MDIEKPWYQANDIIIFPPIYFNYRINNEPVNKNVISEGNNDVRSRSLYGKY